MKKPKKIKPASCDELIKELNKLGFILLSATQQPNDRKFYVEITNAQVGQNLILGVNLYHSNSNILHDSLFSAIKSLLDKLNN